MMALAISAEYGTAKPVTVKELKELLSFYDDETPVLVEDANGLHGVILDDSRIFHPGDYADE